MWKGQPCLGGAGAPPAPRRQAGATDFWRAEGGREPKAENSSPPSVCQAPAAGLIQSHRPLHVRSRLAPSHPPVTPQDVGAPGQDGQTWVLSHCLLAPLALWWPLPYLGAAPIFGGQHFPHLTQTGMAGHGLLWV